MYRVVNCLNISSLKFVACSSFICKYAELYALILSQRNRTDTSSSDGEDNHPRGYRAGGTWEYEENYRTDPPRGTSSSSYPVVPTQPCNDEFRPKKETQIKKVFDSSSI